MRFASLTAALLASIALTPAAIAETAAPAAAEATSALPAITVTTAATRRVEDHVLASGMIGAVEQVLVPPLVEGQPIETLLADVGDRVTAGQVLATLSQATLTLQKSQITANAAAATAGIAQAQAQLINAKTSADVARKTAERSAALLKQGQVSTAANDSAQSAYTAGQSALAVAEQSLTSAQAQQDLLAAQMANIDLQLQRTSIVAPVSGLIATRNAQIGAIASSAGQPLFVIIRDGALELSADVAEVDLSRLQPGQTATVTLTGAAQPVTGTIRLVAPTIDTTSRLGNARVALDANPAIRSGMYAEADILVTAHDALAVPVTAVGSTADGSFVMAVKDGTVKRLPVTTGIRQGAWVEILSGLTEGDSLVAKAAAFVADGDKINPIPSETN
jgi:HlyD family secretion protein